MNRKMLVLISNNLQSGRWERRDNPGTIEVSTVGRVCPQRAGDWPERRAAR